MAEFSSKTVNPNDSTVYDINVNDVNTRPEDVVLIDVRRPEEFTGELGHISGSKLLTLDTLNEQHSQIPKDKTVVLICRSGARSCKAASFLLEKGYTDVYNMEGGMIAWNENNLPIEK